MKKIFELRDSPELKFILNTNKFDIVDAFQKENNGTYYYTEIKNIVLKKEQTNLLISIMSIIIDLFSGSANGGKFKTKANLILKTENQNLKLWLDNTNFANAEKVTELIKSKKPT